MFHLVQVAVLNKVMLKFTLIISNSNLCQYNFLKTGINKERIQFHFHRGT